MKCSFCGLYIRKRLGFDMLFEPKENFQLCATCAEHIDINVLKVGEYTLYYFAGYEFLKDGIYSIKYFGDVACAMKFKSLFERFFSLQKFDLVTIVSANEIRKIIRGFDHIEEICKISDVKFVKILGCEYREKQSKLHKKRIENRYHFLNDNLDLKEIETLLIIDDIYTSGSTLLGCARTIHKAYPGIKISFLTLSKVI